MVPVDVMWACGAGSRTRWSTCKERPIASTQPQYMDEGLLVQHASVLPLAHAQCAADTSSTICSRVACTLQTSEHCQALSSLSLSLISLFQAEGPLACTLAAGPQEPPPQVKPCVGPSYAPKKEDQRGQGGNEPHLQRVTCCWPCSRVRVQARKQQLLQCCRQAGRKCGGGCVQRQPPLCCHQ